jgi:hypothetical protein
MTPVYIVAIFILLLGAFVYWILPEAERKILGVLAFLVISMGSYFGAFELLGAPKPLSLEWRNLGGSRVLSFHGEEDVAIWFWLMVDGTPRQYVIPWSVSEAEAAEEARRRTRNGGMMVFNYTFSEGGESSPSIQVQEPSPLPPKEP